MHFARLKDHDYRGEGYYFVTFATAPRRALLSEIRAGQIRLAPEGRAVVEAWQRIPADDPAYSLRLNVVMPDHFHGIFVCKGGARYSLPQIVERMKARSRQAIRRLRNAPALDVWEDGFHDFVAFTPTTFNAFADYVRDNPRRWQLRHDNPQWFAKQTDVLHPRLPPETRWTAYGDHTLLDYPWLEPVVLSRRLEGVELETEVARFLALAREGAVLIGGFISLGERRVAREAAAIPRSRLVYLHPWGLSRYKPHGRAAKKPSGNVPHRFHRSAQIESPSAEIREICGQVLEVIGKIGPRACLRAIFWGAVTTNGRHRFPVYAQKRLRAGNRSCRASAPQV